MRNERRAYTATKRESWAKVTMLGLGGSNITNLALGRGFKVTGLLGNNASLGRGWSDTQTRGRQGLIDSFGEEGMQLEIS